MIRNHLGELTNGRLVYAPAERAAATLSTDSYDTCGSGNERAESGLLHVLLGATSGTPDAMSFIVTLYDKAASGDSFATTGLTFTLTAADANTLYEFAFKPSAYKRYQQWQVAISFTGGSTPKIFSAVSEIRSALEKTPG